jgi:hypothetical protein
MGAAGKIAFIESRFRQQAPHRCEMNGIAAVRGASHGKLVLAKPEGIGGPALNERNGLQRLDGRAGEDRAPDIAKREQQMPLRIGDGDGARMAALDERTSRDLDEDGVVGGSLAHAA